MILLGGILATLFTLTVKADTIAQWTFESGGSYTGKPQHVWLTNIVADLGSGTASCLQSNVGGYSAFTGNGSSRSLSTSNLAVGDFFQFAVSTIGYTNIAVSFDQTSARIVGPRDFYFEYSENGLTFTKFGSPYMVLSNSVSANNEGSGLATTAWNSTTYQSAFTKSFNLGALTSINNANEIYFRLVVGDYTNVMGNATTINGLTAIDNFTVTGALSPAPEPATLALAAVGGLACFLARRSKRS